MSLTKTSKFLSLVLRHQPEVIGLTLDGNGWAEIDDLIERANGQKRLGLTHEAILEVVRTSDKQRFALSTDGKRIRANQGHSVAVDVGLNERRPPDRLYHGTAERSLQSIRKTGLDGRSRLHVHLSPDMETATKVGARHGTPVVLIVMAAEMVAAGHVFYLSDNGVWLTDAVPPQFIGFPEAL